MRGGQWAAKGNYPLQRRIWGKKAGILGLGRIGFEIAQRLRGFCFARQGAFGQGLPPVARSRGDLGNGFGNPAGGGGRPGNSLPHGCPAPAGWPKSHPPALVGQVPQPTA
ncbi:NAD(P)-dependent oxidoreductase [Paracoccus sp. APAP_BH8]|uniref:NAD(P)-dependent oxidoreductase n=1 Tax=Paracoccus sp. APAP_BH8 TaxID=3110237 RepID=UPI002FD7BB62